MNKKYTSAELFEIYINSKDNDKTVDFIHELMASEEKAEADELIAMEQEAEDRGSFADQTADYMEI